MTTLVITGKLENTPLRIPGQRHKVALSPHVIRRLRERDISALEVLWVLDKPQHSYVSLLHGSTDYVYQRGELFVVARISTERALPAHGTLLIVKTAGLRANPRYEERWTDEDCRNRIRASRHGWHELLKQICLLNPTVKIKEDDHVAPSDSPA